MEQSTMLKKCPYCAEEIQAEAIKCKHCGEMLNSVITSKNDTTKIYYVRTGLSYNWIKSPTQEQAIEYAYKNYGIKAPVFCDLGQVITDMTSRGWSISHRDNQSITFFKSESDFNGFTCFLLLLLFIVPGIIYAIETAAPKTISITLLIQ